MPAPRGDVFPRPTVVLPGQLWPRLSVPTSQGGRTLAKGGRLGPHLDEIIDGTFGVFDLDLQLQVDLWLGYFGVR